MNHVLRLEFRDLFANLAAEACLEMVELDLQAANLMVDTPLERLQFSNNQEETRSWTKSNIYRSKRNQPFRFLG